MAYSINDVKQLRQSTGAPVLDCKKALEASDGDLDNAISFLRRKGLASAAKKASREANDGLVAGRIAEDGQTGALVKVRCETDFVARNDEFKAFVSNIMDQIIADPSLTNVEALTSATYAAGTEGKTVAETLTGLIAKIGENMILSHAARYQLAEAGLLDSYIHMGGRVGVLVEAVGATADDVDAIHDVALQIAAAAPRYANRDEVPQADIDAEKSILMDQLANDNKPDNIKEKIVTGRINKWYGEVVLVDQPFVKDPDVKIGKMLAKQNSDIKIKQFVRFEIGAE